jgi:phosphopantetheinyl transferase
VERDIYLLLGTLRNPARDGFTGISAAERQWLGSCAATEQSAAFYTGRKLARELLQHHRPTLAEREFLQNPWGKPYLDGAGHFSIAHGAGIAGCVWSQAPVGFNLQTLRMLDYTAQSQTLFCRAELQHMAELAPSARRYYFYQVRSAKRALCKAIGQGQACPLLDMGVHTYNHKMGLIHYAGIVWHVHWQQTHGENLLAVVSEEPFQLNEHNLIVQQAVV